MNDNDNTEELIAKLSEEGGKVTPVNTTCRSIVWIISTILFTAMVSVIIGLRGDLPTKMAMSSENTLFLLETFLALATGLLSALAANWLSIPDVRQQKWVCWLPFAPFTLLCLLVGYQYVIQPIHLAEVQDSFHCAINILFTVAIPAIVLFILLKCAASTHSRLTSIMAVMAVAGFGYFCSRLICPNDELGHLLLWHYLPTLVIAAIGAVIGNRLLRW